MARIVVVGSGFAGVEAVARLSPLCERHECLWVTRSGQMVFLPLLPAVASGRLGPEKVSWSVDGYAARRGFTVVKAAVAAVRGHHLMLGDGERLEYDYALLCPGARPNFYGVPGAEENSVTLYSVEDAITVRRLLGEGYGFIIVGAGPVGVELAGELAARGASVTLVEMLDKPLAMLGNERASTLAARILKELGVELALGSRVTRVGDGWVEVEGKARLGCHASRCAVVWTAGIQGPDIEFDKRDALSRWGFIAVDATLRVRGYRRLFAAGDAISFEATCPPLKVAREAIRMARLAARNIAIAVRGGRLKAYRPLITTCRPLLGVCIADKCITILGKNVAFTSKLPAWYHEKVRARYEKVMASVRAGNAYSNKNALA